MTVQITVSDEGSTFDNEDLVGLVITDGPADDRASVVIDTTLTADDAHELERVLRKHRLTNRLGKQEVTIPAGEVQIYDVIESLGMTVKDVLYGDGDEAILQSGDMEIILPSGLEIVVIRELNPS